jgi:hypothetical protein
LKGKSLDVAVPQLGNGLSTSQLQCALAARFSPWARPQPSPGASRGARDAIVRLVRPHAPERALKSLVTVVATMVIKNSLLGFAHGKILPRVQGPARVVKRN